MNRMNSLMDPIVMLRGEMMEWINQLYMEYKGTNVDPYSNDIGYREGMKDALSGFREYVSREILNKEEVNGLKAKIRIEVQCSNCGGAIGDYYHNAKSVSRLKEKTKDWIYDDEFGSICPECQKELRGENDE